MSLTVLMHWRQSRTWQAAKKTPSAWISLRLWEDMLLIVPPIKPAAHGNLGGLLPRPHMFKSSYSACSLPMKKLNPDKSQSKEKSTKGTSGNALKSSAWLNELLHALGAHGMAPPSMSKNCVPQVCTCVPVMIAGAPLHLWTQVNFCVLKTWP